ncbi:GDP-mannose 4,6-dehydratase [candidate division KSB1 bacterium]
MSNKSKNKKILITGGAGFIGINTADYFINKGWDVVIFDNFSRKGVDKNILWLKNKHKDKKNKINVVKGDLVTDYNKLKSNVSKVSAVIHLAAQVAVTTSVEDPRYDFENNVITTFNVLEAIRLSTNRPSLIYASTNKVYGGLEHHKIKELKNRYEFKYLKNGVNEKENLDFHSPYGCSKGSADQYVRDYSRIYNMNTVVCRQSCIYGQNQFGIEDQGWVAWFIIASALKRPITIFGTGKQIRDILYVDDLSRLYYMILLKINKANGNCYNVGGGPSNTLSLIELLHLLKIKYDTNIKLSYKASRTGDQPVYVSDIRKIYNDIGWKPKYTTKVGVNLLIDWVESNKDMIKDVLKK